MTRPWNAPIAVVLVAGLIGAAPAPSGENVSDHAAFDSLVATEKAFAALAVEKSVKTAFLTYLASDGLVFSPGPIIGREAWQKRAETGGLVWEPSFAEVSGAGDLGWTTGPWEFRPEADRPAAAYGHFVTVWKKVGDGTWRAAVDLGISHAQPERGFGSGDFVAGPFHPAPKLEAKSGVGLFGGVRSGGTGVGVGVRTGGSTPREKQAEQDHETNTLLATERTYAFEIRTNGEVAAITSLGADDMRLYRAAALPLVSRDAAAAWLNGRPSLKGVSAIDLKPASYAVSSSADLGYSAGLMIISREGARSDTSSFLHIWRKDAQQKWKLAMDVANPFPRR